MNYKEAQEQGNTFHYEWFLPSILLVASKLPADSQFPPINQELPKTVKYALLWATKDTKQIHAIKVFCVMMEASIRMWINRRPWLSPIVYTTLQSFSEFKADMHNIHVRAWKDLAKEWTMLPFIAIDDTIFTALETWLQEWRTVDLAGMEKATAQQMKKDTKLHIM